MCPTLSECSATRFEYKLRFIKCIFLCIKLCLILHFFVKVFVVCSAIETIYNSKHFV